MKKLVLFFSLLSSLFAVENGSYIGVGSGYSMLKVETPQGVSKENSDGMTGVIALGYKYNEHGRIYAVGMYRDSSNAYPTVGSLSLAYDFLVPMDQTLSLYVGPVAGYTNYISNSFDSARGHYGVEVGAVFNLKKELELEMGYRILKETFENTTAQTRYSATSSQTFLLQLNFYFDSDKYFKYND